MDEFASPTGIAWEGGDTVGVVEYGDKNKVVMFYNRSVHNPSKSKELGRPTYEDKVFVRVHPPGERLNIVDRPATGEDSRRWPTQWAQFRQNAEQIPDGTPIGMLYPQTPSIADTLRANGVFTIEQCANLSGHAIDNIGMGAQEWVNAAVKYLEVSNKGVKGSKLQAELDKRDGEIRVLKTQVDELKVMVEKLTAARLNNDLAAAQRLIAGHMAVPEHMPSVAFDPQTEQINATSERAIRQPTSRRPRSRLAG